MQRVLRSETWRVRAEVRGRRDMTEKRAEKEDMTEEVMWFTGEQEGSSYWKFSTCRGGLGVNLKHDWSGNIPVPLGEPFTVHRQLCSYYCAPTLVFPCLGFSFQDMFHWTVLTSCSLLNLPLTAKGHVSYIHKQKAVTG